MGILLAYLRLFCILLFIPIFLLGYFVWSIFGGFNMRRALKVRRTYLIIVNKLLGLKVKVIGNPPEGAGLCVANHRNFIDPFIIIRHTESLPVAKAEIAKYPLIGKGAALTGIIYVDRSSKDSRYSTKEAIKKWVLDGFRVLIYPEGTVNSLDKTAEFKLGSFKIAATNGFKIFPLAIEFQRLTDRWHENTSIMTIFKSILSKPTTNVTLSYGESLRSDDPVKLMTKCKEWIDNELIILRKEYDHA